MLWDCVYRWQDNLRSVREQSGNPDDERYFPAVAALVAAVAVADTAASVPDTSDATAAPVALLVLVLLLLLLGLIWLLPECASSNAFSLVTHSAQEVCSNPRPRYGCLCCHHHDRGRPRPPLGQELPYHAVWV